MNSTQGVYSSKTKPLINTFYCISRSLYSQNLGKYVKFVRIVRLPIFCYSFDLRYKFHYHPFPPPGASRRMYMPLILPRKNTASQHFILRAYNFPGQHCQLNDIEKIKEILPNSARAKAHPQLGCAGVPREYGVDTFEPDLQTKNY